MLTRFWCAQCAQTRIYVVIFFSFEFVSSFGFHSFYIFQTNNLFERLDGIYYQYLLYIGEYGVCVCVCVCRVNVLMWAFVAPPPVWKVQWFICNFLFLSFCPCAPVSLASLTSLLVAAKHNEVTFNAYARYCRKLNEFIVSGANKIENNVILIIN